jgi:drug/metabolite transporter (DMT)-like permease
MNTVIRPELVLLAVAFLWGINPPIMKVGLISLPPLSYNAIRMMIALVCAIMVLLISKQYRAVEKRDIIKILKVSIFGFFVFQFFFTLGIQRTTAGNASLILGMLPVWVAILNKVFKLEEDMSKPVMIGIGMSFAGILLIILGSGREMSFSSEHMTGALLLSAAQIGYAYYTIFSKELTARYSYYQITTLIVLVNMILFALIAMPELIEVDWRKTSEGAWLSAAYSGIFAMCIGNFLWIWGVSLLGSATASLYNNLSPIFAIIVGYLLLGEPFGLLQFVGAAIVFWGLYLTRKPNKNSKEIL